MSKHVDPAKALDTFFSIIRQEALANPAFGRRLIEAVGYTVTYRGEEALAATDPVLVAMSGAEEFRRTFLSMRAAEIKKLGEASGLFAKKETLPRGSAELVDILWSRASERLRNLVGRQAAE